MQHTLPLTLPQAKAEAEAAAAPEPETYPPAEIAAARSHCTEMLRGLDVVVIEEAPIKSGSCGAIAPVQLISVGRNPQVALSPPVTMTCAMVSALHQWVTKELQPSARKHLGTALIGIDTMSSYSCRNAYGRKRGNLSEHGRANAIDIRAFQMANAQETSVLASWGPTAWEIRAQVVAAAAAAAKLAAAKVAADAAAAAKAAQTSTSQTATGQTATGQTATGQTATGQTATGPTATGQTSSTPAPGGTAKAGTAPAVTPPAPAPPAASIVAGPGFNRIIESVPPAIANRLPGAGQAAAGQSGYGWTKPSQLGGPKVPGGKPGTVPSSPLLVAPTVDGGAEARRAQFLRDAHTSACRIFGTTLGPETNLAHKNHFHLDMAERASGKNYCE